MSDYNIREAFEKIEDELIDSMMRNFSRHRAEETKEGYNWTQWQAEQLKSLEEYRKHNAKKFGKRFKTINGKVEEMIRTAKADGNASQEAEILEAVKDGFKAPKKPSAHSTAEFFKVNDRKLDALIKSTTDDLKRAETAVLRMSNDKYRKAIFNAQVAMNTGAVTYEKAVDIACKDMLNAGLNCVEYKNGARHTLSDYADMAVKTANKRAYLRGEGEKRAEWGVSLVVVNSRQGGCPDCAKYIGKVFIDDVYSNGKKSDGNYPLLSTAIENGLFHPRCKDSTSTYYPELDDLDAPLSEDEIKELDRQRGIEEKQQYAQRQAERFDRRAEYSLDEDNKRIAQTRADEWHDRADMLEEKAKKAGNSLPESVAKSQKTVIMKSGSDVVALENQRYGRNKSTLVNKTYVDSGEYKRKYDSATDNKEVNKSLYDCAKKALKHRSGTAFEDMYWIDGETGRVMLSVTDSADERTITYTDRIKKCIQTNNNVVTIHTHPSSMPPSIEDFNSCANNGYAKCFVACHNGVLYGYHSNEMINPKLYNLYIQKYMNGGFSEMEAQVKTIKKLSQSFDINFWEVSYNG
ncbi:phage minor capsid protein [Ruminococcus bromii]|uniref:phage minor capsid protein n=1 Tax=Ruminococcus bromii TaxID=40518 RepID=UPI003AB56934